MQLLYNNSKSNNREMLENDGKCMYIDCKAEDLFSKVPRRVKIPQLSKDHKHINKRSRKILTSWFNSIDILVMLYIYAVNPNAVSATNATTINEIITELNTLLHLANILHDNTHTYILTTISFQKDSADCIKDIAIEEKGTS